MAYEPPVMTYETPVVRDHGTLVELTAAVGLLGTEDGGSKFEPAHHNLSTGILP